MGSPLGLLPPQPRPTFSMPEPTVRHGATSSPTVSIACPKCGAMVGARVTECAACGAPVAAGGLAPDQGDRAMARIQAKIGERFQLLELLGRGGMGIVFRALEKALDREVAVKVLAIDPVFDPDAYSRFEREAKLAARLDHPGIVPIFTVATQDSLAYYTMRLVRGGSVDDMLEARRTFDLPQILGILRDVAGALDYAHQNGVVHRDIKPANILLSETGHACVADFGIAKALGRQDGTTGTAVIGSPAYMSPEQWRGDTTIDGRADQYALAVVAFELITGRRPFNSQNPQELLRLHCTAEVPDILALRPGLDPSVGEAITRAMSKRSAERFGTATAFVESLAGRRPVAVDTATRSLRLPKYQPPPPRRRRGRLAVFIAVVAAGVGAWFAPQSAPLVRPAVASWAALGLAQAEVILSGLQPLPAGAAIAAVPAAAALVTAPDATPLGESAPLEQESPDSAPASTGEAPHPPADLRSGSAAHPSAGQPGAAGLTTPSELAPLPPPNEAFRPVARHGFIRVIVRGGAAPVLINGEGAGVSAGPAGQVVRAEQGIHNVTVRGAGDLFMPSQVAVTVATGDTATALFTAATAPRPATPAADSTRP